MEFGDDSYDDDGKLLELLFKHKRYVNSYLNLQHIIGGTDGFLPLGSYFLLE